MKQRKQTKPEPKEWALKEIAFMKKNNAPKAMIRHEKREAKGKR